MSRCYLGPRERLTKPGEKNVSLITDTKNVQFMGHRESQLSNCAVGRWKNLHNNDDNKIKILFQVRSVFKYRNRSVSHTKTLIVPVGKN